MLHRTLSDVNEATLCEELQKSLHTLPVVRVQCATSARKRKPRGSALTWAIPCPRGCLAKNTPKFEISCLPTYSAGKPWALPRPSRRRLSPPRCPLLFFFFFCCCVLPLSFIGPFSRAFFRFCCVCVCRIPLRFLLVCAPQVIKHFEEREHFHYDDLPSNQFTFTAVDPSGGGASEYAICSLVQVAGMLVVRRAPAELTAKNIYMSNRRRKTRECSPASAKSCRVRSKENASNPC